MAILPSAGLAQAATSLPVNQTAQTAPTSDAASRDAATKDSKPAKPPTSNDKRRAAKLYLSSGKLFVDQQFEEALKGYEQAAALDPSNTDYNLAANVARSHAVTALIQTAAKDRLRGDEPGAHAALSHALELDPRNIEVTEHLYELGDDAIRGQSTPIYEQAATTLGAPLELLPAHELHSFHLRTDQRQIVQQVFKAYGVEAAVDESVRPTQTRFDIDDASFEEAARVLSLLTNSFFVPLDAHRVLVARDTRELRQQFTRLELETIYLSGLSATELTDVGNLAKNVFEIQQAATEPSAGTITLRAPARALNAFNRTMRELLDGRSQVLLEVRIIEVAHTSARNTGVQPPQTMSAFNVYAEEQSILNANQSLVQQIISSGLAAPGDTLAILGILLASGQVSSSLFSNGVALFGGGITQSALAPGSMSANFNLNTSESRQLDQIQLRLGNGEEATLKEGTRYPIQTSSYSSGAGTSVPKIPGLTGAGSSSSLGSLLSEYSSYPNIPQLEYQDLGLTLKTTANVMRNDEVALTFDMKITALTGSSVNGNPILSNQAFSDVFQLQQGEGVVVMSELDSQQSRAIDGVPGISEIPGLNDLTGNNTQKNYSTLLVVVTPHVIRGTQAAGHSPMMRVERGATGR